MKIEIEISESDIKNLLISHLESTLGNVDLNLSNLKIMVKSQQNFKSEWEVADFKAVYNSDGVFKSEPKPLIPNIPERR